MSQQRCAPTFDPLGFASESGHETDANFPVPLTAASSLLALATAFPADAAVGSSTGPMIPSAIAAYVHYLGLVLVTGSLVTERLLIKAGMSDKDETMMGNADILYGLAGTAVTVSGYFRVTQYGKGWEFYAHSPVFWVKMFLFAVMGAASFFPTTKIVQRAIAKNKGEKVEPLPDALAARMTKIINGELLAIGSIPLAAACMARGVAYSDAFPWQLGAGPVALAFVGLGAKYTKEALDWYDDGIDRPVGDVYPKM
jgi:uncharacterized membrane protein